MKIYGILWREPEGTQYVVENCVEEGEKRLCIWQGRF